MPKTMEYIIYKDPKIKVLVKGFKECWYYMIFICCVNIHVQYMTQYGVSALQEAAMEGKTDVVVELVKNGASLNLQDEVCHYIQ